jgi:hypothetical protein
MSEHDRRARAEARRVRTVLRRTRVQPREPELDRIRGSAALSLVHRLTLECWSFADRALPAYGRSEIPHRFVRRPT